MFDLSVANHGKCALERIDDPKQFQKQIERGKIVSKTNKNVRLELSEFSPDSLHMIFYELRQ